MAPLVHLPYLANLLSKVCFSDIIMAPLEHLPYLAILLSKVRCSSYWNYEALAERKRCSTKAISVLVTPPLSLSLFSCLGLSFSPTDTKLATCSDDGTVRIWDFIRSAEEFILRGV